MIRPSEHGYVRVKRSMVKVKQHYHKTSTKTLRYATTFSLGSGGDRNVSLQLLQSKCIPVLLYGLEACPLSKARLSSTDFVLNRFLMKLFQTSGAARIL